MITYDYDALNLRSVTYNAHTHYFTSYDLSGNLLSEEMIDKWGTISHSYDLVGRHSACNSPYFTQQILKYDPVGNILQSQKNDELFTYAYDDLYQLTSENGHTYMHDAYHNRLAKDDVSYEVNALNQMPSVFTYNPDGNPILHGNARLTYDAFDRLISYETDTGQVTFTYDSLHRRISKTINGQTTYYLYDDQNEIGSISENTQELRILGRTPNAEIGSAIILELNRKTFVPLHDLHGNAVKILSPDFQEEYKFTLLVSLSQLPHFHLGASLANAMIPKQISSTSAGATTCPLTVTGLPQIHLASMQVLIYMRMFLIALLRTSMFMDLLP